MAMDEVVLDRGRGRPRLNGDLKAERIHFTASKGFRDRLKAYSDRTGLTVAEILRSAAEKEMASSDTA